MRIGALLKILIIAVLLIGFMVTKPVVQSTEAHETKGHDLHSAAYETVYYDPNDKKSERGIWLALISLVPGLKAYPVLQQLLGVLGLGVAFHDYEKGKAKTPSTRYVIEKLSYKVHKPTNSYFGYYEINVFNTKTKKWHRGKHMVIGKTSY